MRRSYIAYWSLGLALSFGVNHSYAQQGFGTDKPSRASVIDMESSSKGLLIPRVALEKIDVFSPIQGETSVAKTNSLLVYNTANTAQNDKEKGLRPGYYYWTATADNQGRWNRLIADTDAAALELLVGDVAGPLGGNKIVNLQGKPLDLTTVAPAEGNYLVFDGQKWVNKVLTAEDMKDGKGLLSTDLVFTGDNHKSALLKEVTVNIAAKAVTADKLGAEITDAGKVPVVQADGTVKYENVNAEHVTGNNLTAVTAEGKQRITITGGEGTVLKETTLDVNEANLNLANIGGLLPVNKLVKGTDNQVLVTVKEGDQLVTKWVDKKDATTNSLTLADGNKLTSTVNGTVAELDLSNKINTEMLQNYAVTKDKINADVAGLGLSKNTESGALDVNFGKVKEELAKGTVASSSITVDNGAAGTKTTFSDVKLEIKPGSANQVMVTSADGKTTTWVDQSTIVPATTVANNSTGNELTTTVNNVKADGVKIINSNELALGQDNMLTSTVNGVASASGVNLKEAVERLQKTTSVKAGTNVTVTPEVAAATGNTEYTVSVSKEDIQANQQKTVVVAGEGVTVTPAVADNTTTYTIDAPKGEDINIYTHDGKIELSNGDTVRRVNLNKEKLYFQGEKGRTMIYDNGDEFRLDTRGSTKAVLRASAGESGFFLFQEKDKVSQITTFGPDAGINISATSSTGLNKGISFSLGTDVRASLDASKTFKVGVHASDETRENGYTAFEVQYGQAKIKEINKLKGASTDKVVVADADGVLKTVDAVKAGLPKFFHMPAVFIPTHRNVNGQAVLLTTGNVLELHAIYSSQFSGADNTTYVSSNSNSKLPILSAGELDYFVTWFDKDVFTNVKLSNSGKLTYDVKPGAVVTAKTFMNIVFKVKD